MGFNGIQWDLMGFNGIQWDSMVIQWDLIGYSERCKTPNYKPPKIVRGFSTASTRSSGLIHLGT